MATAEALAGKLVQPKQAAGLWSDAFGRLRKNKLAVFSGITTRTSD